MSQQPQPVTVQILDRDYQIMCQPEERRSLMEAALYLDKQMRSIRDSGKLMAVEKIAVMCALNLADELLKLRQALDERHEKVDGRIRALSDQLDRALGDK